MGVNWDLIEVIWLEEIDGPMVSLLASISLLDGLFWWPALTLLGLLIWAGFALSSRFDVSESSVRIEVGVVDYDGPRYYTGKPRRSLDGVDLRTILPDNRVWIQHVEGIVPEEDIKVKLSDDPAALTSRERIRGIATCWLMALPFVVALFVFLPRGFALVISAVLVFIFLNLNWPFPRGRRIIKRNRYVEEEVQREAWQLRQEVEKKVEARREEVLNLLAYRRLLVLTAIDRAEASESSPSQSEVDAVGSGLRWCILDEELRMLERIARKARQGKRPGASRFLELIKAEESRREDPSTVRPSAEKVESLIGTLELLDEIDMDAGAAASRETRSVVELLEKAKSESQLQPDRQGSGNPLFEMRLRQIDRG